MTDAHKRYLHALEKKDKEIARLRTALDASQSLVARYKAAITELRQQGARPRIEIDEQPVAIIPVDVTEADTPEPRDTDSPSTQEPVDFGMLAGLTNNEIKEVAKGMVAERAPRDQAEPMKLQVGHGGVQEVRDKRVLVDGGHKDGIGIYHDRNAALANGGKHTKTNGSVGIYNCSVERAASKPSDSKLYWGGRHYNVKDFIAQYCDFISKLHIDWDGERKSHPEIDEHGFYVSVAGDLLFADNSATDLGGQFLQMAGRTRAYQGYKTADVAPRSKPGVFQFLRNVGIDLGCGPRGSAAFTLFDPGTPEHPATVLLGDNWWVSDFEHWRGSDSRWRRDDEDYVPRYGDRDCEAGFVVTEYELAQEISENAARGPIAELFRSDNCVWVR
ncbi:MAG: hypothetical protein AAFQ53_07485, partial [Bacteroidota bacterium]